jgi:hypothetical protein
VAFQRIYNAKWKCCSSLENFTFGYGMWDRYAVGHGIAALLDMGSLRCGTWDRCAFGYGTAALMDMGPLRCGILDYRLTKFLDKGVEHFLNAT